jgi:hypothetical protein
MGSHAVAMGYNTRIVFGGFYLVTIKAILLQALTGPEGSRRMRFPDIKTIGT